MKNSNKIKRDVLALYSILYPKDETERQLITRLFSKEVLKLLRYTPSEIEIALSLENDLYSMHLNDTAIEHSIKDKEDVRIYVFTYFGDISKHIMSEEKIAENLRNITLQDLKYMYSFFRIKKLKYLVKHISFRNFSI